MTARYVFENNVYKHNVYKHNVYKHIKCGILSTGTKIVQPQTKQFAGIRKVESIDGTVCRS